MRAQRIVGIALCFISLQFTAAFTGSSYEDDSNATYWIRERNAGYRAAAFDGRPIDANQDRTLVARKISFYARQNLGNGWEATALRLARIESNYRCSALGPRTSHGRAVGPLQILPGSAEALEPGSSRRLRDCDTAIRLGVLHMRRCLDAGVRTSRQMAACHVAGWKGWNRRLARNAERYKQRYIALAEAAVPLGGRVRIAGAAPVLSGGWNAW